MKTLTLLLILMCIQPVLVAEELFVVVSTESKIESLSKSEVIDLFMGRYVTFPNGVEAKVFDLASKSEVKMLFYKQLVNRSEAQINAYWAMLLFSGRNSPPKETSTPEALISEIKGTVQGIGYISSEDLTDDLKVVYRFETF
jgi:hypothetical protein